MDIQFLGTGGAFDLEFGNSSAIINLDGENILIDCGFSVFPKLVKTGLIEYLDKILITHLHDDHVGGLSSLILYYYYKLNLGKVEILVPNHSFKNEILNFLRSTTVYPEKYVTFSLLDKHEKIKCIDTSGQHIDGMTSFGYAFFELENTIVYSGDIANADAIFEWLKKHYINNATIFHDICFHYNGVHTFYKDLIPYLDRYQIFGYHCNPKFNVTDNPIPLVANQKKLLYATDKNIKDSNLLISKRA
jgi:ribonuclease BN (tRNA processing enzyme)